MTNTDPAGFDSEATGAFRVAQLSEKDVEEWARPEQTKPLALPPVGPWSRKGPALVYAHSDGRTFTDIDHAAPDPATSPDDKLRELMLARALLRHALHLVDKELNGL